MDPRLLLSLFMLTGICFALTAKAEDNPLGIQEVCCAYTVTTNPLESAPGEAWETRLTRKAATRIGPARSPQASIRTIPLSRS